MLEIFLIDGDPLSLQRLNSLRNVNRVPENNCCNHQIQRTSAVALIFVGAVSYLPKPVETDSTGERIASFALVESHQDPSPQFWALEPLQGKEAFFDTTNLS